MDAGKQLADRLLPWKYKYPLVLALPRGGVPVGFEVAKMLNATLDTLIARKIVAPWDPELGVGAVSQGDVVMIDNESLEPIGVKKIDLNSTIRKEVVEMEREAFYYHSGKYTKGAQPEMVLIIDDGFATELTAQAAIESVKNIFHPKKIIYAVPICARDLARKFRKLVDIFVCVNEVDNFGVIGNWYQKFNQTTDDEVVDLLERANARV